MWLLALAVLVGFALIAYVIDQQSVQIARLLERIVLLLARDVEERSQDRVARLEHDLAEHD